MDGHDDQPGRRDRDRQRYAWAGGLIGILAGVGATLGVLVAGGEGIALGAGFGAAAGVLASALLNMRTRTALKLNSR